MSQTQTDIKYMRRALQLAACGASRVSPNPQVGAVIVAPDGRIIGEGYHRTYGEAHAEPNAVNSVRSSDRHLLPLSTIYVTLEPCSHYGKTPPCADLLIRCGVRRAVIGTLDPFPEVSGRGVTRMRQAGIQVDVGCLEDECRAINRRFITAHTHRRPYIQLKWAQTADGYIGAAPDMPRAIISSPLSMMWMHRQRSLADAIFVGHRTILLDHPSLTCRLWPGRNPLPLTFQFLTPSESPSPSALSPSETITPTPTVPSATSPSECITPTPISPSGPTFSITKSSEESLSDFLSRLYTDHKITSLMVEGGAQTLQLFLDAGLYDEIRIETSPLPLASSHSPSPQVIGTKAPALPSGLILTDSHRVRANRIDTYRPAP